MRFSPSTSFTASDFKCQPLGFTEYLKIVLLLLALFISSLVVQNLTANEQMSRISVSSLLDFQSSLSVSAMKKSYQSTCSPQYYQLLLVFSSKKPISPSLYGYFTVTSQLCNPHTVTSTGKENPRHVLIYRGATLHVVCGQLAG